MVIESAAFNECVKRIACSERKDGCTKRKADFVAAVNDREEFHIRFNFIKNQYFFVSDSCLNSYLDAVNEVPRVDLH